VAKVRLSPAVAADLEAIDEYGAEQFGQDIADAYSRGFNEVFALLRRHPEAGQAQPEYGRGIRSFSHRKHRIFYTVSEDTVVIVRIVHHAQDAKRALN
jgi:toxin ParE1/3/4